MEKLPDHEGYSWIVYRQVEELGSLASKLQNDDGIYRDARVISSQEVQLSWEDASGSCSNMEAIRTAGYSWCYFKEQNLHQVCTTALSPYQLLLTSRATHCKLVFQSMLFLIGRRYLRSCCCLLLQ